MKEHRNNMKLILLSNIAATFFMVGIIWFVQIVHYPLYNRINPDAFPNYEVAHVNLITLVVGPAMFIEAGTALLMLVSPPQGVPLWVLIMGLVLVAVVWAVTMFINVPQHNQLSFKFDEGVHRALVLSNWVRTVAWSVRGVLMLWVLSRLIG